jgi:PPOX class probable F420-dependent enzyme
MKPGVRELFGEGRNFATLATLLDDGSPHAATLWTGVEGERLVFFSEPGSRKARNIRRDARVALAVADAGNPYRTARVRGRVVERREGEQARVLVDRISERYTGEPFTLDGMAVYVVEITHQGFDEHDALPSE